MGSSIPNGKFLTQPRNGVIDKGSLWGLLLASAAGSLRNPVRARLELRREIVKMLVVLGVLIRRIRSVVATTARPHRGIGQLIPIGSVSSAGDGPNVIAFPVLNGLHHDYRLAA